jgi:OOP family OmpA-OmpF porin
MRRIVIALLMLLTWISSAEARQAPPAQSQDTRPALETRPATVSVSGDTGLWFLPTAEILPHGKWSLSLYRANADFGQGFTDVSNFPVSFAVGLADRVEVFGSWTVLTRIDRDARPLFFADTEPGSGGGIVNEYPLVRQNWTGNSRGDLRVGAKLNLLSQADDRPLALALRGSIKLPSGDEDTGASTGKTDYTLDLIASGEAGRAVELTATAGIISRGDPDGFDISNGIRWGVGAAFLSRLPLRLTAELHGERYSSDTITARPGFVGEDFSLAPGMTTHKSPLYAALGLTWQAPGGIYVGGGLNWSSAVKDRLVGNSSFRDSLGIQARIGYHPGVRKYVEPAPAPVMVAPVAVAVAPPPANRPPTVRATCDPCTVEVGRTSTVTGIGADPDGDVLTYRWTSGAGTLSNPNVSQTPWTAPMVVGPVPFTVTVTDPGGLSATANVTIQVVEAAIKEYVFEDVHFDFDQNTLRSDALAVLDGAITALKATPNLKLQIEGHTCNIGTAEYNMALSERRALAVRAYLESRGISGDRLTVVSYGEERPKHDNSREETRRLNRRAALVVTVVR